MFQSPNERKPPLNSQVRSNSLSSNKQSNLSKSSSHQTLDFSQRGRTVERASEQLFNADPGDVFCMEVWQNSRLNKLPAEVIVKNSSYIWGFGDNSKRALAV